VKEMGSHWVLFLLYLNIVLKLVWRWPFTAEICRQI